MTGAAVQWLRDGLGLISEAAETEALAASLDSNDGVYFVPALTGLGSPHWDPYARGTIVGLTRGTGRAHLARAALEAIAYQTVDAVEAMEAASGEQLAELRADGGAVANRWLMQFQADVLGRPVVVPEMAETTALGAAYLAGVGAGLWTLEQTAQLWREAARYEPRMADEERAELLDGWRRARRCNPGGDVRVARSYQHAFPEAPGLHRPAPGGVLPAVPRPRARRPAGLGLQARAHRADVAAAADLPVARDHGRATSP